MDVSLPGGRQSGQNRGFFLSRKRDVKAVKTFLRRAMTGKRLATKIKLAAYVSSTGRLRISEEIASYRNGSQC